MGRILSIDYGRRRTGLAITDELQMIANPMASVETKKLMQFLIDYTSNEVVERFIIGLPKQMNYTDSESMKYIKPFFGQLKKQFPNIPIEFVDERFTSKMASRAIAESGKNKKARQDKALIDRVSAAIILQTYLTMKK